VKVDDRHCFSLALAVFSEVGKMSRSARILTIQAQQAAEKFRVVFFDRKNPGELPIGDCGQASGTQVDLDCGRAFGGLLAAVAPHWLRAIAPVGARF
jgi:hypothetical protein